jgi:hypothetical protein
MNARHATAALLLALATPALGCAAKLPLIQAASATQAQLSVFVDVDATVGTVVDERGKDIIPMIREAIDTGLADAGYHVVTDASGKADVTIHVGLAKVGYAKYGTEKEPWAQGVVLDVFGGGQALTRVKRHIVNWSDCDGPTVKDRLRFAGRDLVNDLSRDDAVAKYAAGRPPAYAKVSEPAATERAPVTMGPSTPAAAPTPAGVAPAPAPPSTP